LERFQHAERGGDCTARSNANIFVLSAEVGKLKGGRIRHIGARVAARGHNRYVREPGDRLKFLLGLEERDVAPANLDLHDLVLANHFQEAHHLDAGNPQEFTYLLLAPVFVIIEPCDSREHGIVQMFTHLNN